MKEDPLTSEIYKKRHSLAHVLAEAVLEKFPDAKLAIGPPTEEGFYYDFQLPRFLKEQELPELEAAMRKILTSKSPFVKQEISYQEAQTLFHNQPFKLEILQELPPEERISVYQSHHLLDLCKGPHVSSMQNIDQKSFKLTRLAGAYWRGDENNTMLQRIYGVAFDSEEELHTYLQNYEQAILYDHRKLGKAQQLFFVDESVGAGLILWKPKAARIRLAIEEYWRDLHQEKDYEFLFTPHVGKAQLWETSGHLDHYQNTMFPPLKMEKDTYYLRPMNCPFHIQVYQSQQHSYKQLPIRYTELGTVYRYEKTGVLHGLLRVRGFTQDDGHVICRPDQVEQELHSILAMCIQTWHTFGFTHVQAYLSTKPDKAIGETWQWDLACQSLEKVLQTASLPYEIDSKGGAFYGPKIDLKVQDSMKRQWQTSTIQFDFSLPQRFGMAFINSQGKKEQPYVIHRALFGSLERFLGILLEHYKGRFPFWLAPLQVVILPVHESVQDYAQHIAQDLRAKGFSTRVDEEKGHLGAKIKAAQEQRIPYMLILGAQEKAAEQVTVRSLSGKQQKYTWQQALTLFLKERTQRSLTPLL